MAARSTDYDTLALRSGEDASPQAKGGDEGTFNNKWTLLLIGVVTVGLAATKSSLFGSEVPAHNAPGLLKQMKDHPVCRDDFISPAADYYTAEKLSEFLHGLTDKKLLYTEDEISDLISRVDVKSGERNNDPMTYQVRMDYIHVDTPNAVLDVIYKASSPNPFPSPIKDIGIGFSEENALWGERIQVGNKIVLNILTMRKSNEDGTMSEVPPDYSFTPGDIIYLIPATEIGFPVKHVRIELTSPTSTGVTFSGYGVTLEESGVLDFVGGFKGLMVAMGFGVTDIIVSAVNC